MKSLQQLADPAQTDDEQLLDEYENAIMEWFESDSASPEGCALLEYRLDVRNIVLNRIRLVPAAPVADKGDE